MRKRITAIALCSAFFMLFALSAAGCSSGGESGKVLRVYNWEDYISDQNDEEEGYIDLIAAFEADYLERTGTPVRVEYSTFGTNENMYNELKINAAGYDLVCPSDYMIMKMIAEDMVEPFSEAFLTEGEYARYASPYIRDLFRENYAEVNGEQRRWSDYAAAYMWGTMGYVYNPALVDEQDLSVWSGIWSDKYANMSTIKDSVRDSYFLGVAYIYQDELFSLKKAYDATDKTDADTANYNAAITDIMNRTDSETIEAVKDALIDLKQYLYGFEVDSGKQDMIAGRISINFAWSGDAVFSMDDAEPIFDEETGEMVADGIYLNYIIPEECTNIWFDGWVMPKGADTELAEAFINFLSRPENAVANMNFIGYTSAVAGDEVYEEMIDWYDESAETGRGFDAEGNPLVPYDLNYFFRGTGSYDDYVIYVSQESLKRQISAQYPSEDVIARSAVMQYFDNETNAAVNEMWEEVKGLPIPIWAYIVIAAIAALIIAAVLSYLYKGKRSEPKPKKGYKILKKGA